MFGLYLPQLRMSFATIEARARAAEEAGFDSLWLMDHLAAPAAPHVDTFEGWTIATALAMRTERIRIGHLVLCDPFRHPALLAKMAATLDVISGGRLDLGLGWGSVADELRAFGFGPEPAPTRAARMGETLEVLAQLFTGEPVTFHGDYVQLDGAQCRPTPVNGRLPVHIGGAGERLTMPLVAKYADWWNCPVYAIDRLEKLRAQAGTTRISTQHVIALAPSAAARDDVLATAQRRFGTWGSIVGGTPDEVADVLRAERDRGVELCILQFSDFAPPETIELFMREVAPAVAS